MRLETARRPAANKPAVDIEFIGLIGRDEKRRDSGKPAYREYFPEKSIAIMDIPVGGIGPNPKGLFEPGRQTASIAETW